MYSVLATKATTRSLLTVCARIDLEYYVNTSPATGKTLAKLHSVCKSVMLSMIVATVSALLNTGIWFANREWGGGDWTFEGKRRRSILKSTSAKLERWVRG